MTSSHSLSGARPPVGSVIVQSAGAHYTQKVLLVVVVVIIVIVIKKVLCVCARCGGKKHAACVRDMWGTPPGRNRIERIARHTTHKTPQKRQKEHRRVKAAYIP